MEVDLHALGLQPRDDLDGGRAGTVGDPGLVRRADDQHAHVAQLAPERQQQLVRAHRHATWAGGDVRSAVLGERRRAPPLAQRVQQVVGVDADAMTADSRDG